jgi:hypothetical protein
MNVLVGPNNAGKSSILDAFRLLAVALRHARRRIPTTIVKDGAPIYGWEVPPSTIPLPLVNIHSDADADSNLETSVTFGFSSGATLTLLLRDGAQCFLKSEVDGPRVSSTSAFRAHFPIEIFAFPTLGPFEEDEEYLTDEYVERFNGTRRSHRMFRNIWYRQPHLFPTFQAMVEESWGGITIGPPERFGFAPPHLQMFFEEGRMPREISWAGFGFQVWLQLLTHISTTTDATVLVVDEPEIYLHPDLQRRLFELLRATGKQIILATHSAEIVNDAERDDVVLVNRARKSAKRIGDIEGLQDALFSIGSAQNIHLTKLSRGRRVLFFEGQDFRQIRRLAARFGYSNLADGGDLTVVPIGGFAQKQRIEDAAWTFGQVLKAEIEIAGLLDRDYRPNEEIAEIVNGMRKTIPRFHILGAKEIENYLLVPHAIHKAVEARLRDRPDALAKFSAIGDDAVWTILDRVTASLRDDVAAQLVSHRVRYWRKCGRDTEQITQEADRAFEAIWADKSQRLRVVPGKTTLASVNSHLQTEFGISITGAQITANLRAGDLPSDLAAILENLNEFARKAD